MEVKGVGRRYSMVFCAGMMGASLILFRTVDSVAGFVGLNTSTSASYLNEVLATDNSV